MLLTHDKKNVYVPKPSTTIDIISFGINDKEKMIGI